MKVLIIEDEKPAVAKLELMLHQYDPEVEVVERLVSVEKSIQWFKNSNNHSDLIFMDIRLVDGLSFEIFDTVKVDKPIIFITAYNEYAIQAFKVNSIDYLLKPLKYEDFYNSMEKIKTLRENLPSNKERLQYNELSQILLQLNKNYKTRFLVKVGDHIKSVKVENISMFFAEGRIVYILTNKGNKYIIDNKLETLESSLDPDLFFRVNRTFILNLNSIKDVIVYSNSRLKVITNQEFEKEIVVSREKVGQLKTWFEGLK